MHRAAFLAAGLLAAACSTEGGPYETKIASTAPPTFAALKSEIDTAAPCSSEYYVRRHSDASPMPPPMTVCPHIFPEALQRAGVEGACMSMFDIDAEGRPVNIEPRCRVGNRRQTMTPGWQSVAEETFVYAVRRAVAQTAYPKEGDPAGAGKWRTNLAVVSRFQFGGEDDFLPRPPPFQRAPPALVMTADQKAVYDKLAASPCSTSFYPPSSVSC